MLIFSILSSTLLAITVFRSANAQCNVCQANGAACINSTSFYMCYGNSVPNYDRLYHCNDGFDCTNLNAICVQSNAWRPASCGDTALCGLCSAHRYYTFACTSRNTFRMCYGSSQPKSELGYCPDGYVCDTSSDNVCVPLAQAKAITCDVLSPINGNPTENYPTTSSPSTDTPLPTDTRPLTAQEVCDVEQKVGVYQIPGDISCLEYVRCYMQKSVIYGSLEQCPTRTYFSGEALQCVFAKPPYCV